MQQFIGVGRIKLTQATAYTSAAGTIASAVSTETYKVRVTCTTDAFIRIDNNATAATTTDAFINGNSVEYFTITPGQQVSALQSSAAGNLFVTEII